MPSKNPYCSIHQQVYVLYFLIKRQIFWLLLWCEDAAPCMHNRRFNIIKVKVFNGLNQWYMYAEG